MKVRLIFAIVSTTLEEVAIVVVARWGLPRININIPVWGLVLIMVAWAAYAVFTFRIGSRALVRRRVNGLTDMIGSMGKVVSTLNPEGLVKIKGELWVAKSTTGEMQPGDEVTVVGQERLKLTVQENDISDSREETA
ncbi:NfeD family protein [Chloroflexota bacterium]